MKLTKPCSKCKAVKALELFKPDSRFGTGRRPACRACEQPSRAKHKRTYKATARGRALVRKHQNNYYRTDRGGEARRETARKIRVRRKLEALSHYSKGEPKCKCCGVKHLAFLTIDHINGNGRKHRDKVCGGQGGTDFYRWLANNN